MMFRLTIAIALALSSSTVAQAQEQDNNEQEAFLENFVDGCADVNNPDLDYFPVKYERPSITSYGDIDRFGEKFVPHTTTDLLEITYHNTYKIIHNKYANTTYLLYQCGTEPPPEEVDSGRHHLILSVPHQGGVVIRETPQIPPMELLGLREEIVAYIGNPELVSSPCLMHMMEEESVTVLTNPEEDLYNSTNLQLMQDAYILEHPEAIVFGGIFNEKSDRVLSVAASQERTNVATFDWLSVYAALYNLEGMANEIKRETQARYDCSSKNAQILIAEEERRDLQSVPSVLWANYFEGYGWSVAECTTWDETYYCEYAKHCGAEIIARPEGVGEEKIPGYYYLSAEEMSDLGKDADIWIYPSRTWDEVYGQFNATLSEFKSVQNQQVYDTQGMGPFSWYEQRLAEYDVVGLDFCDLVGTVNHDGPHPHTRRWFRNIYTEPILSLEECQLPEELSQPYVPQQATCDALTAAPDGGGGEVTEATGEDGEASLSSPLPTTVVATVLAALAAITIF